MTIQYRTQGRSIIVFGNTYPHKEKIKALGGRFNGSEKTWRIPLNDANLASVDELVKDLGGTLSTAVRAEPSTQALVRSQAMDLGEMGDTGRMGERGTSEMTPDASGLTIRQLMDKVQFAVARAFSGPVWVIGEVQNLSRRASGCFFDLAEPVDGGHQASTTTIRAILWQSTESMIAKVRGKEVLQEVLQEGIKVRFRCQVSIYKERGHVSLHVEDVDPSFTKGALALAREKLLKELRAKGLDRANKALPLTPFPFRIGLITADGSRAHSDFVHQLERGGFAGEVLLEASPMQGEAVPQRVVQALARLTAKGVDAIVLTRGGGSAADLRWFDAPEIAYAIAGARVPVICAIGHHDDVCVAEEISYRREKTPTAAAEFVLGTFAATRERIDTLASLLAQVLSRRIEEFSLLTGALAERLSAASDRALYSRGERLSRLAHGLVAQATARLLSLRGRIDNMKGRLDLQVADSFSKRENHLGRLERELVSKDPKPWLAKGWTQLTAASEQGEAGPLLSAKGLAKGTKLKARLLDGRLTLTVDDVQHIPPSGGNEEKRNDDD